MWFSPTSNTIEANEAKRTKLVQNLCDIGFARNLLKPLMFLYGTEWNGGSVAMDSEVSDLYTIQNRNTIDMRLVIKWCCYITVDPETPAT